MRFFILKNSDSFLTRAPSKDIAGQESIDCPMVVLNLMANELLAISQGEVLLRHSEWFCS